MECEFISFITGGYWKKRNTPTHMLGEDGLVELLKQNGYTVEKV